MILLKYANNKAFTYGAKQIFERAQLLHRARWGKRNLVENQTVTDGWTMEESAI
jgi:hypothetical protein